MTDRRPFRRPRDGQPGPPRRAAGPLAAALAALLAACGSAPPRPAEPGAAPRPALPTAPRPADSTRDGPGHAPPPDLHRVPDATPRLESPRPGGPNKPYEVLGQAYTPLVGDPPLRQSGLASWYGRKFHGRATASGEAYNMYAMTAAHKTMPLPSYARVRNPANGREVVVRVNDRGPFHADRVIDLSYTAAWKLGILGGVATVEVERITYEAIRTGAWRAPTPAELPELPSRSEMAMAGAASTAVAEAATAPPLPEAAAPAAVPDTARAAAKAARGWWLQLGAFRVHEGAARFQQQVAQGADWLAPLLTVFDDRRLHRLQAGPFASRADAQQAAERVRVALQLVPAIVERR